MLGHQLSYAPLFVHKHGFTLIVHNVAGAQRHPRPTVKALQPAFGGQRVYIFTDGLRSHSETDGQFFDGGISPLGKELL